MVSGRVEFGDLVDQYSHILSMIPPDHKTVIIPQHFYALDALRGLAALGVVFWHWQHFFFAGVELGLFDQERQPFYFLFKPLYTDGWRAVDLFFCLSGFIFFWLYSEKIQGRNISWPEFWVLRLSRLYPLHLMTLLLVAIAQHLTHWQDGEFFVYRHNDFFHFVLQAMFASSWGFEKGDSFNGPIWSVSVEMALYAIFFLICRLNFLRWWQLAISIGCGYLLTKFSHHGLIGRGMISFFAGGLSFYIFSDILLLKPSRWTLRCLGVFTALMWIFIPINTQQNILYHFYLEHLWSQNLGQPEQSVMGWICLNTLPYISFEFLLFPLTIITLALWETNYGRLSQRLSLLGNISYSSYLLHFPLEIICSGVALSLSIPKTFFYTPVAFISFFIVLILLSFYSYQFLERPCQLFIRERFARYRAKSLSKNQ
jgi:peptidoglycan/LPS O-acetylase OafA/YrhL